MTALQFRDAFWGADFSDRSGYEAVLQRLQDGRRMCKDVEELLRMRAVAEEKFGKELVAIARRAGGQTEISTLRASIDRLKAEMEHTGSLHVQLSGMIKEEVQKIEAFREHQREQRKKFEEIIEKVQKPIEALYKRTMESKRSYEQRCKEADEAEQAVEKKSSPASTPLRPTEKVLNRARLCREAARLAEKQYMWHVDKLENTRQDWESTYRSTCEVFQQQESDRIGILRCVLWDHCNQLSMQCVKDDECYEEVRKILEECDIAMDNNHFIQTRRTGSSPPKSVEFQNYYNADTNGNADGTTAQRFPCIQQETPVVSLSFSVAPSCGVGEHISGDDVSTPESRVADEEHYKVLYDYKAQDPDELSITRGEVLLITDQGEDGWWTARRGDLIGLVPGTYLIKL
ncbi:proline-serine-threonine phosphatase-interacting protein 1b isoform X2 [Pygocentrus nattereri]|uniref:Proline-serine-threonine phosphatase interacting protein 1b n=1 Tax=Pygocentrus nattereri TaxID=42514 RepID=A0A3B4CB34_PYGNA|nr:proline-serine-threonine phosphatase-interacting protein 1b isoform X2 [Pygocentrus nattereri]